MEEHSKEDIFLKYKEVLSQKELPTGQNVIQDLRLDELNCIVSHLDDFVLLFPETSDVKSGIIAKLCELIVHFGLVNIKEEGEDREYSSDDFPFTAQYGKECFEYLKVLFHNFEQVEHCHKHQIIVNSLLLCATHNEIYQWSNENSVSSCKDFLALLLTVTNHEDLSRLLCNDDFHPTIFKRILKKLRPSLMKNTWKQNPSSCHIFSWLLHQVKHPYLADFLADVFPPPCMFISDYIPLHKMLGIRCFDHILENVPPTLMKIDGKEDVIYHSLSTCMYTKELEINTVLYPCLLKLPSIKSQKMTHIYWSNYDDVLNRLLMETEMEFAKQVKQLYLSHIHSFILITPPFKHLKRLLNLVEDNFCKETDNMCLIKVFAILEVVIKSCWPRMKHNCFKIMKSIIILLNEIEERKDQLEMKNVQEIHDLCEKCLALLKCSCETEFQSLASEYVNEASDLPGVDIIKSVLKN